jgi:N6-adenosine-specific RNA methylase IME4
MPKAASLLISWGFRWVTMLTWPKPSFGMGNYFRGQTEHVVFAVRGSLPLARKDASTLLPVWARGAHHSAKPAEFLPFVESCSPGPYVELFARSQRDGWRSWGADA